MTYIKKILGKIIPNPSGEGIEKVEENLSVSQNTNNGKGNLKRKVIGKATATEQIQSDWNQSDSTKKDFIKNKPTIPTGVVVDPTPTEDSDNPVSSGGVYADFDELSTDIMALSGISVKNVDDVENRWVNDDYKAGDIFKINNDEHGYNNSRYIKDREFYVAKYDGQNEGSVESIDGNNFINCFSAVEAVLQSLQIKLSVNSVSVTETQNLNNTEKQTAQRNIGLEKNAAGGVAALDQNSKISVAQLPDTVYEKPKAGIPKTDLSQALQSQIDSAVQLEGGKIPAALLPDDTVDEIRYGYLNPDDNKFYKRRTGSEGSYVYSEEMATVTDIIYVDKETNKTYRWGGESYVPIGSDLAIGETSSTAFAGDRGKALELSMDDKQDVIADLEDIRSGAEMGSTSVRFDAQPLDDSQKVQAQNNIMGNSYAPAQFSGLGKKILAKNIKQVGGVQKNVLEQSMVPVETGKQTIYVIQFDYDLNGATIRIPDNSVLKFDGGSLSNGTIVGNNVSIESPICKIFGNNIELKRADSDLYSPSAWNVDCFYAEWFGAKGDGVTDDTLAIQATINNAELFSSGVCQVKLLYNHTYNISSPILVPAFTRFGGLSINEPAKETYHRPCLHQTTNGNVIELCGRGFQDGDSANRILISDLYIAGQGSGNGKGISLHSTCPSYTATQIDGITFDKLKFGIYLDAYDCFTTQFKNICNVKRNVAIGMYLRASHGCWGLNIVDCYIAYTTIGGIYFEAPGNSGPVNLLNTYIEGCGNDYTSLADIYEWGCWGLYIKGIGSNIGNINIDNCYFESNSPFRTWVENDLHNDNPYGFIEAEDPSTAKVRHIYITNPDFRKTAQIVINSIGTHVNVTHTHFSVEYQTISIVKGGILSFIDNDIFVPSTSSEGCLQDSIVKVYDETEYRQCNNIGVRLEKISLSKSEKTGNIYRNVNLITKSVDIVNSTVDSSQLKPGITDINPNDITLFINNGVNGERYEHRSFNDSEYDYGEHGVFYISQDAIASGIGALGCPCTFARAVYLINMGKCSEITFILLDDIQLSSDCVFAPGIKYNFISLAGTKRTITFPYALSFKNSDVVFKNVNFVYSTPWAPSVYAYNSSVTYINCNIDFGTGSDKGVCLSRGITRLSLQNCVLDGDSIVETTVGNKKENGLVFVDIVNCTNTADIQFTDDSDLDFDSLTPTT